MSCLLVCFLNTKRANVFSFRLFWLTLQHKSCNKKNSGRQKEYIISHKPEIGRAKEEKSIAGY